MELTPEQLSAARELLETELREQLKKEFTQENSEALDRIVDERLSKMKASMDALNSKLEAEKKAKAEADAKAKALERERMEAEGKHLELRELELKDLKAALEQRDAELLRLTRDAEISAALAGLEFRNDFAYESAFQTLSSQMVRLDSGDWKHKTGVPIKEYVEKVFTKEPKYADVLLKPKENQGSGAHSKSGGNGKPASVIGLTAQEMIEMASRGELGSMSY